MPPGLERQWVIWRELKLRQTLPTQGCFWGSVVKDMVIPGDAFKAETEERYLSFPFLSLSNLLKVTDVRAREWN